MKEPRLIEAWVACQEGRPPDWVREGVIEDLMRSVIESHRVTYSEALSAIRPRRKRQASGKPRKAGPTDVKTKDRAGREAAARAAAELSASWRPLAGVCKGLGRADPLVPKLIELTIVRVRPYESRGVWAALRVWRDWEDHRSALEDQRPEALPVHLAEYIRSQPSSSGPAQAWSKFDWLRRVLDAPVNLSCMSRKPTAAENEGTGEVKEVQQALVVLPEYLWMVSQAAGRMHTAGDWRAQPVACGVTMALSVVRHAHLNRSRCTHKTSLVIWWWAFRGKKP